MAVAHFDLSSRQQPSIDNSFTSNVALATEDPRRADGEGIQNVDSNVEYCAVIKTKLGAHRVLMGAKMDCCDSTDDGTRFYVELKTSRESDSHTEERFEREKLLKFWDGDEIDAMLHGDGGHHGFI